MIANPVKLVVWDLDETFWRGTLDEGGATAIPQNVEIVRVLAERGIVSAICSKNDLALARAKLEELGVWELFVFSRIAFVPKGQAVAEMIVSAQMRPENVLVLDDNEANLEEIEFCNPGVMTARPNAALPVLLDHVHLAGRPDPSLMRLSQYRRLERRTAIRTTAALSNEEFLRASRIRLRVCHDIEEDFARVVELINRANQLNYTKRRVDTAHRVEALRKLLRGFSIHAGTVWAADVYGDYGLVGFFLLRKRAHGARLIHFVFSCRVMHMGIEQYVYETLGKPEVKIAGPVAYGLDTYAKVDWVDETGSTDDLGARAGRSLLLLGGCDLLQLSSYCGNDRLEFVNKNMAGTMVRYDDPFFILGDRNVLRQSEILCRIPSWNYDDVVRFDDGVNSRELIVLSFWPAMNGDYFQTKDGVMLRMNKPQLRHCREMNPSWFTHNFMEIPLQSEDRLANILAALDAIAERRRDGGSLFVLGCNTRRGKNIAAKQIYNEACRSHCEARGAPFHFVDVDHVVPERCLTHDGHFSREGYLALAQNILGTVA